MIQFVLKVVYMSLSVLSL